MTRFNSIAEKFHEIVGLIEVKFVEKCYFAFYITYNMAKKVKQKIQLVEGVDPGLFGQKYS